MTDRFAWKIVVISSISSCAGIAIGYLDTPFWLTVVIGVVCNLIALRIMRGEDGSPELYDDDYSHAMELKKKLP